MEVVFERGADEFDDDGHNTDSTAKKQPATAALNPEKNNFPFSICMTFMNKEKELITDE